MNLMAKSPSESTRNLLGYGLITLNLAVVIIAVFAWGSLYDWHINSIYGFFPLLGLLAFSLMWTHYVAAAVNRQYNNAFDLRKYYEWTGWVVIVLVVLHPVLLWYALFRDGLGLPPGSYLAYVGKAMHSAALLGTAALIIFIAYEFKPWVQKTRFLPVLVGLNDLAMFFIFIHARRLGGSLQLNWFHTLWTFYGIVLIVCILQRLYFIRKKVSFTKHLHS
jgi:hypothetical protein